MPLQRLPRPMSLVNLRPNMKMATPSVTPSVIVQNPEHGETAPNVARLKGVQMVASKAKLTDGRSVERNRAIPGRTTRQSAVKEPTE